MHQRYNNNPLHSPQGILFIDKPVGKTSHSLVSALRRRLGVQKIGHCGTLDPAASGLMILLVGREYTRLSDRFLGQDKEYIASIRLGIETDSYDGEGQVTATSDLVPTSEALQDALLSFQGEVMQIPPMFSAKKQKGRKLYELARKGQVVERAPVLTTMQVTLLCYEYPHIQVQVACSKGTYVRTIAYDLGRLLGCGAHLENLRRTRSGSFHIDQSIDGAQLDSPSLPVEEALIRHTAEWNHDLSRACHT